MLGDKDGELVLPVIKNGRPGTAMVAIPMSDENAKAVVAYIHSLQAEGSQQGGPPPGPPVVLNILVGDPRAGSAYFTANCSTCHSTTGDLAGVAGRVEDAKALQNLWVSGGRTTGAGGRRRRGGSTGRDHDRQGHPAGRGRRGRAGPRGRLPRNGSAR